MQYQCLCVASHKNNLIDVHSVSSHIKSVNIDWHCTCDKVNTPINSATQIIHHQVKRFINKVVPNGLSHHCWAHIGTPFHKEPASLPPFSGTRCKGSKLMVYMETCKRACYSCFFCKTKLSCGPATQISAADHVATATNQSGHVQRLGGNALNVLILQPPGCIAFRSCWCTWGKRNLFYFCAGLEHRPFLNLNCFSYNSGVKCLWCKMSQEKALSNQVDVHGNKNQIVEKRPQRKEMPQESDASNSVHYTYKGKLRLTRI